MKRNQIQGIRVHFVPPPDGKRREERVSEFHAALIERRLNGCNLPQAQKCGMIDEMMGRLQQMIDGKHSA